MAKYKYYLSPISLLTSLSLNVLPPVGHFLVSAQDLYYKWNRFDSPLEVLDAHLDPLSEDPLTLLLGGMNPVLAMKKDLIDTVKPFKSYFYVFRDLLQPFRGLGNMIKGGLNVLLSVVNFIVQLGFFLTALGNQESREVFIKVWQIWKNIVLRLQNMPGSENRFDYFIEEVRAFWEGNDFIRELFYNRVGEISASLGLTLLTTAGGLLDGLSNFVRGATQVLTTPLTWFARLPLRGIITAWKGMPSLEDDIKGRPFEQDLREVNRILQTQFTRPDPQVMEFRGPSVNTALQGKLSQEEKSLILELPDNLAIPFRASWYQFGLAPHIRELVVNYYWLVGRGPRNSVVPASTGVIGSEPSFQGGTTQKQAPQTKALYLERHEEEVTSYMIYEQATFVDNQLRKLHRRMCKASDRGQQLSAIKAQSAEAEQSFNEYQAGIMNHFAATTSFNRSRQLEKEDVGPSLQAAFMLLGVFRTSFTPRGDSEEAPKYIFTDALEALSLDPQEQACVERAHHGVGHDRFVASPLSSEDKQLMEATYPHLGPF